MVGRHGDLGGPHEVEVLALDPVDVVGGLPEEAGAVHRPRLDQRGRDDGGESGIAGLLHGQVDQRELQLGADAGQEVEARPRHLGAALDVDGPQDPAELDVVARLEVELSRFADRLEDHEVLLATGRCLVGGEVGDAHHRRLPLLLGRGLGCLGGLHVGGEGLGAREKLLLLVPLGLRDQLAQLLLLGPLRLEVRDRGPPGRVGGERPVHDIVGETALGLRGAHAVRLVAEDPGINHLRGPRGEESAARLPVG